jgi:hypothetical protein
MRKDYEAPKLTVLGSVATLTQLLQEGSQVDLQFQTTLS